MNQIQKTLFSLRDEQYLQFQFKLLPTIAEENIIGVRTPALRSLAKELYGTREADAFLSSLPHRYFEENQLHSFLISLEKDFDRAVRAVSKFLPYVDNWETCDQLSPTVFRNEAEKLLPYIERWMQSDQPYTQRFGIEMLMNHFLDARFHPSYLRSVAAVESDDYYVCMMISWFFATALAKQWDDTIPYIRKRKLSPWIHKKAIQKAVESYRIPTEQKVYLRTLR